MLLRNLSEAIVVSPSSGCPIWTALEETARNVHFFHVCVAMCFFSKIKPTPRPPSAPRPWPRPQPQPQRCRRPDALRGRERRAAPKGVLRGPLPLLPRRQPGRRHDGPPPGPRRRLGWGAAVRKGWAAWLFPWSAPQGPPLGPRDSQQLIWGSITVKNQKSRKTHFFTFWVDGDGVAMPERTFPLEIDPFF